MNGPRGPRLAVDIGGTFTDIAVEIDGEISTAKTLTTPERPVDGVVRGIDFALERTRLDPSRFTSVIHGTTLATNALIERRGAKVGVIGTEGFRDVLEIGYERRYDQYDLHLDKPDMLVPRDLVFTVAGRVDVTGVALEPLDEASLARAVDALLAANVESVAVGLLHSYRNPAHEERVREVLAARAPNLPVSLSSEVSPEIREFDRLCTTVANAYIKPLMAGYLAELEQRLGKRGFACPLFVMTSGGGMTTLETAMAFPVRLVESGPSGGAILAARVAAERGIRDVLSFDMGGTTAKVCLIEKQRARMSRSFEIGRAERFLNGSGLPVRIPVIEMIEIGAGGGSIAGVDGLGRLRVGPRSASADPGPACYGRGGTAPTVTDADLVAGYLDPSGFAEGRLDLCPELARRAIATHVAGPLGQSVVSGADGISRTVDEAMANAARMHAVEQGRDLGACTLVAFGGNGPLHATRVAEKVGIGEIVVPPDPSVGSAVGFLFAPVSYEIVRSHHALINEFPRAAINRLLAELEREATAVVRAGAPEEPLAIARTAFMRYRGQGHEIEVAIPGGGIDAANLAALVAAFEADYARRFGRVVPEMDIEVMNWSVVVSTRPQGPRPAGDAAATRRRPAAAATRSLAIGQSEERVEAAVHRRQDLRPGDTIAGPALIVEPQTTAFVSGAWTARVDPAGNLVMTRRAGHDAVAATAAATTVAAAIGAPATSAAIATAGVPATFAANAPTAALTARAAPASTPAAPVATTAAPAGTTGVAAFPAAATAVAARSRSGIELQVQWDRLMSIVEEQGQVLMRTAFSPIVRECGDISAGIFDPDGNMLAQAVTGTPGHVNTMAEAVKQMLPYFPAGEMAPGDVCMTNDPWLGAGHLNDIVLVAPIFHGGRLVAFTSCTSHVYDLGGLGMGPDGSDVHDEGLYLPPLKLVEGGRVNRVVMDIMKANSRSPTTNEGDLYALIACCDVAGRRLSEMMGEFSMADLEALAAHVLTTSQSATEAAIARLPNGTFENEIVIDGYDFEIALKAALRISDKEVLTDFGGSSGHSARGINVPINYSAAYGVFAMRCLVANGIPNNAGSLAPFRFTAPPDCILNAQHPAPVAMRHIVGHLVSDLVLGAMHQVVPGAVPAEGSTGLWDLPLRSAASAARPGRNATAFATEFTHSGGTGARPTRDGLSATAFPSGVYGTQVEIAESTAPVRIRRRELICDSGGAGRYRGGLGQIIELESCEDAPILLFAGVERTKYPARGREGGANGSLGRITLRSGATLAGKGEQVIPAGDLLRIETPGGGGYGSPLARPPAEVERDVRRGLVSTDAAYHAYGVVLGDDGRVDVPATEARRRSLGA